MYCESEEGHGRCFTPISAVKRCPKRGHHADAGGQGGMKTNLMSCPFCLQGKIYVKCDKFPATCDPCRNELTFHEAELAASLLMKISRGGDASRHGEEVLSPDGSHWHGPAHLCR